MTTPLFLTDEELHQLTARKFRRLQVEALRKMGVPFRVNPAGKPIVCRSAVEGGKPVHTEETHTGWTPRVMQHGQKTN